MIDNEKWQIMVENHLEKGYILYFIFFLLKYIMILIDIRKNYRPLGIRVFNAPFLSIFYFFTLLIVAIEIKFSLCLSIDFL